MKLSMILACDSELGIGKNNALPWNYPEDLKFFKETTAGATCVMGRLTYESMVKHIKPADGAPLLKGRKCVVVSSNIYFRNKASERPGTIAISELAELDTLEDIGDNVFIIGGAKLYEEGIKMAKYVYITDIPGTYGCDVALSDRFVSILTMKFENDWQQVVPSGLMFTRFKRNTR
jgi:dihydrofolate reductase